MSAEYWPKDISVSKKGTDTDSTSDILYIILRLASQRREDAKLRKQGQQRAEAAQHKEQVAKDAAEIRAQRQEEGEFKLRHSQWQLARENELRGGRVLSVLKRHLSQAELDEQIWARVDTAIRNSKSGLRPSSDEAWEQWNERITVLNKGIVDLWNRNNKKGNKDNVAAGGGAAGPRYIEGLPAYLIARPPTFAAHIRISEMEASDRKCLQCMAKRLRCSQQIRGWLATARDARWPHARCSRCARNGDECLTWQPQDEETIAKTSTTMTQYDGSEAEVQGWVFAEPPARFQGSGEDGERRRQMREEEVKLARALCDVRDGVVMYGVAHRMERVRLNSFAPRTGLER